VQGQQTGLAQLFLDIAIPFALLSPLISVPSCCFRVIYLRSNSDNSEADHDR